MAMKAVEMKAQPHSYINGANQECRQYVVVLQTPGFVEIRRMRSDGRAMKKFLLTDTEARELSAVLQWVMQNDE